MGFEPTSLPPVPSGAHPHVLPARIPATNGGGGFPGVWEFAIRRPLLPWE